MVLLNRESKKQGKMHMDNSVRRESAAANGAKYVRGYTSWLYLTRSRTHANA